MLFFLKIKAEYPYSLYSMEAETVAKVLHMQISWSWSQIGQRASVLADWGRTAPVSSDQILGPVVVVHVKQQTNHVQNVDVKEDHNHNEICPRTDATSLDMEASGTKRWVQGRQQRLVVILVVLLHVVFLIILHF